MQVIDAVPSADVTDTKGWTETSGIKLKEK